MLDLVTSPFFWRKETQKAASFPNILLNQDRHAPKKLGRDQGEDIGRPSAEVPDKTLQRLDI